MGKPRLFSTAAVTAMRDPDLTGLDWRVYLWVSLHDGMSLLKGKGMGCIASNKTLFAEVGCDYSSGCRSLSKLVDAGHLVREKLGRATRYRVAFGDADNLPTGNLSPAGMTCQPASETPAITCSDFSETRRNLPQTASDYILQSSRIDFSEESIKDSTEVAHLSGAQHSGFGFAADEQVGFVAADLAPDLSADRKRDSAEAGRGSRSLIPHLPSNFGDLPSTAQVARLEAAFNRIMRDADNMPEREREVFCSLLWSVYEATQGTDNESTSQQAYRLHEEMVQW